MKMWLSRYAKTDKNKSEFIFLTSKNTFKTLMKYSFIFYNIYSLSCKIFRPLRAYFIAGSLSLESHE